LPVTCSLESLAGCRKTIALADTALKSSSTDAFITHKLRFFVGFCIVLPALMTVFNTLLEAVSKLSSGPISALGLTQLLDMMKHVFGLNICPALISNQHPNFETASNLPIMPTIGISPGARGMPQRAFLRRSERPVVFQPLGQLRVGDQQAGRLKRFEKPGCRDVMGIPREPGGHDVSRLKLIFNRDQYRLDTSDFDCQVSCHPLTPETFSCKFLP
jgi:hypothetical protein